MSISSTLQAAKLMLMVGILWVGFSANPNTTGFPQLGSDAIAANGNGNGGNGGNGNGNGNGRSDRNDNPGQVASENAKAQKEEGVHSELGFLNSLSRSIQGMINGKDAKMEEFRIRDEETGEVTGITNPESEDWSKSVSSWIGDRITSLTNAFEDLNEPESHETDSD